MAALRAFRRSLNVCSSFEKSLLNTGGNCIKRRFCSTHSPSSNSFAASHRIAAILAGSCGIALAAGYVSYRTLSGDVKASPIRALDSESIPKRGVPDFTVTLYQYENCPFCGKVRAFLEYYGIKHNIVEVNPLWKKEISFSKYRKVPFIIVEDKQINDSSVVVSALRSLMLGRDSLEQILVCYPEMKMQDSDGKEVIEFANRYFIMYNEATDKKSMEKDKEERKWRKWVDSTFVHTLSPNIYRTASEAMQAFEYFTKQAGSFSAFDRYTTYVAGPLVMYFVGKHVKRNLVSGFSALKPVDGRPIDCSLTSNFVVFATDGTESCWPCDSCPEGQGLFPQCGKRIPKGTKIECKLCEAKKNYSDIRDTSSCKPCHICGLKNVVQECTTEKDRKCGTTCPTGHYYDGDLDECIQCFYCCDAATDDDRVKECKDIGMAKNMQCAETLKNKECKKLADAQTTTPPPTVKVIENATFTASLKLNSSKEQTRILTQPPMIKTHNDDVISGRALPNNSGEFNWKNHTVLISVGSIGFLLIVILIICVILHKTRSKRGLGSFRRPLLKDSNTPNFKLIPEDLRISVIIDLHHGTTTLGSHIASRLDAKSLSLANWKEIGKAFHVPGDRLDMIELEYIASNSPTECLLKAFGTLGSQEPSLREFAEVLHGKGRTELAEYICNWPYKKGQNENQQHVQTAL